MKYLIAAIAIILVAMAGYYGWQAYNAREQIEPVPEVPATSIYATSTFSIVYPASYIADDAYTYNEFEGKPIAGVKFSVPTSVAEGTNLSSFDTGVSVEWLPRAVNCTGDIYVLPNVKAFERSVGSTTYSVATTSGAAAGNRYEEQVYAISGSQPCTAVRYLIHSTGIENYDPGTIREFDRNTLLREFDAMRDSLILFQ